MREDLMPFPSLEQDLWIPRYTEYEDVVIRTKELNSLLQTARAAHRLQEEIERLKVDLLCAKELNKKYEQLVKSSNGMSERLKAENEELRKDAERLDYVLSNAAFIVINKTDAGGNAYQLWSQDEDENIIYLSGEDHFFNNPRKAIDAAMKDGGDGE